jgi:DNA-binding NarL/FixJ family response regulator
MITIVLADDHGLVREAVRCYLEQQKDMEVVGELADGLKVIPAIGRLKPGVLVVSLGLPGLNGFEVTRQVRDRAPETKVVVLSMSPSEDYVVQALRSGASAYVMKQAKGRHLVRAIRRAMAGRRYVSPPFSERAVDLWLRAQREPDPYGSLTNREREVFQLAAEGYSSTAVASRLGISPRTAESHRGNAMRKLGLTNQLELMRYAVGRGFVVLPGDPFRPSDRPRRPSVN